MDGILLIGRHPAPYGGTSVHVQRLAAWLQRDGLSVTVADPYTSTVYTYPPGSTGLASTTKLSGKLSFVWFLVHASREQIVHFHISAGANFYRVAPVLMLATSAARKRVVTIHSGSWQAEIEKMSSAPRRITLSLMSWFDEIVCVNKSQCEYLTPLVHTAVRTIPAFLPEARDVKNTPLPDEVEAFLRDYERILVTSGSGVPLYDYETMIRSLNHLHVGRGGLGLVLATYGVWEQPYWNHIRQLANSSPVPVLLTDGLSPEQFVSLLARCHLFIRASLTDGDSVAVREAIAAGLQVAATNVVPRPPGTVLCAPQDEQALATAIHSCLTDERVGRPDPKEALAYYEQLRNVYGC